MFPRTGWTRFSTPPWIASFLCLVLFLASGASALAGEPVKRRVLVLYDSEEEEQSEVANLFAEGWQMPANYLGLLPEYRDVSKRPLPDAEAMAGYRGVATVFTSERMSGPDEYMRWLLAQFDAGRKVVILNTLGAFQDADGKPADQGLIKEVFKRLGLGYDLDFSRDSSRIKYVSKKSGVTDFERKLPLFPPDYLRFAPVAPDVDPWVLITRTDHPDRTSAAVAVSPRGGFAMAGYMHWQDAISYKKQWYIDPFAFLAEAMCLKGIPAPTPATVNGRRVAISHVDADGFAGFTEVEENSNCAAVVTKHIFEKFNFPVTSSVITAEIDPEYLGNKALVEQARAIYEMPNIEPASHAFSHPFWWSGRDKKRDVAADDTRYIYNLPGYKFNAEAEIAGSVEWITKYLAPKDKPCRVFFWTGACDPDAAQIKLCWDNNILNMNGGDTVYDGAHRSLFGVAPLYGWIGGQYQIYTGQANENILTNLWTGPFFGFANIIESMENTGEPRRLAPIDIYYHFYSGEKFASIRALSDVYEWAVDRPAARMFTSKYIEMVMGFIQTRMERIGPGMFQVSGNGPCTSLRLAKGSPKPDLARSTGVAGYCDGPDGVYAHLDPDAEYAVLALDVNGTAAPAGPYLSHAEGVVRKFAASPGLVSFTYAGWPGGEAAVAGLEPGAVYTVRAPGIEHPEITTGKDGILRLPGLGRGRVEIVAR